MRVVNADIEGLRFAFVTYDDILNLPSMQGETLIAIKAPSGTKLEVPDPDEVRTQTMN